MDGTASVFHGRELAPKPSRFGGAEVPGKERLYFVQAVDGEYVPEPLDLVSGSVPHVSVKWRTTARIVLGMRTSCVRGCLAPAATVVADGGTAVWWGVSARWRVPWG